MQWPRRADWATVDSRGLYADKKTPVKSIVTREHRAVKAEVLGVLWCMRHRGQSTQSRDNLLAIFGQGRYAWAVSERPLISWTPQGLYCERGDFYIDPHRAVACAVVTHAHSDHARRGSDFYITARSGVGLLRVRLGRNIQVRGVEYGEVFQRGSVRVSLHPAGHILGSAQVRVECGGEVWVASGDYKRDPDPSCEPFESVGCDTFITEATFGTPKFAWNKSAQYGAEIAAWWNENTRQEFNSLIFGYSLGKGQRILAELADSAERPIYIHAAMAELTACYRAEGRRLAKTIPLDDAVAEYTRSGRVLSGALILAPPAVLTESWAGVLGAHKTAFASGWTQNGGRRDQYDHGFVLSDHADWNDLNRTIRETGASRVFVQHRNGALVRHLRTQGIEAHPADDLSADRYARLPRRTLDLFGATPMA